MRKIKIFLGTPYAGSVRCADSNLGRGRFLDLVVDLAGCDVAVASGLEGPGYGSGATATLVATATALPAAEVDGVHLDRQESD